MDLKYTEDEVNGMVVRSHFRLQAMEHLNREILALMCQQMGRPELGLRIRELYPELLERFFLQTLQGSPDLDPALSEWLRQQLDGQR